MGDRLNQVEVLGGMAKCMAALRDFEQVSLFIVVFAGRRFGISSRFIILGKIFTSFSVFTK